MTFLIRRWPPRPTLLGNYQLCMRLDFAKQSEWGADEWRDYAQFLEESGRRLNNELTKTEAKLRDSEQKKSRKPIHTGTAKYSNVTLLTSAPAPKPKRGRKPKDDRFDLPIRVLEKRAQIEKTGKRVTDKKALVLVLIDDKGWSDWRAKSYADGRKRIFSDISVLRKQTFHNK